MSSRLLPAAALAALLAVPSLSSGQTPLESLVAAERAFARSSVEKGVTAAFSDWFADDGIWFNPHPERARPALAKEKPGPTETTLDWYPTWSDVSNDGALGANTGPFVVTKGGVPLRRGFFFSMWRRQPDGAWRVALDFGIGRLPADSPTESPGAWSAAAGDRWSRGGDPAREREALRRRELALKDAGSLAAALGPEFRVYREGSLPVRDRASLVGLLGSETPPLVFEPEAVEVARSADLAYAWGKYRLGAENGYYVHLWRRDGRGEWRLSVEVRKKL